MSDPAAATGPIILSVLLGVGVYVWTAAGLHAVFRKSGEQPWKAWVPIVNTVTLLQLGRLSGWWVLLVVFPPAAIVLWVLLIVAYRRINADFGFGVGMTVLAALLFPVWTSIVGWGTAQWLGAERGAAPPGPVRTSPTALDARFGTPLTAGGAASEPAPIVSAVPLSAAPSVVASPAAPVESAPAVASVIAEPVRSVVAEPVRSVVAEPARSAVAEPPRSVVAESAPASATIPVISSARAAAGDLPVGASVGSGDGPQRSGDPALPPPPPPATAAAASTRSPMRGFPGPVASSDPAPAPDPDHPGPLRSRGGAMPAGYDDDDDADVVDDPLDPIAPVWGGQEESPAETPPGPRRAVSSVDGEVDDDRPASARDPWAPPAIPSGATRAPRFSPEPTAADAFSDTSAEVSAVIGAPRLGEPMAARASVSARPAPSEIPSEDALFDQTMIASRRRHAWTLIPPLGAPVPVSRDVLVLGRRPSVDPAHPGAQLVSIADETRTMSKTHARLELHDGEWTIVDLDSTNGVVLLSPDGRETELVPGRPHIATERFLLGDAELRLARDDA